MRWSTPGVSGTISSYQYRHSVARDSDGNRIWMPDWTGIIDSGPNTTSHRLSVDPTDANAFEVRLLEEGGSAEGIAVTTLNLKYLGKVTLAWDDPKDTTITRYEYHTTATPTVGDAETQDWTAVPDSGPGTTSYTFPYLVALGENVDGDQIEVVYTFKIRAVNRNAGDTDDQERADSENANASPGLPLATPTGLMASWNPESRMITLIWDQHPYSPVTEFEVTWRNTGESGGEESKLVSAAQTLKVGDEPLVLTLSDIFIDPDNQDLTYMALSSDPSVATAQVINSTVVITREGSGKTRVTITSTYPDEHTAQQVYVVVTVYTQAEPSSAATWTAIDPGASFGVYEFRIRARHNFGPWSGQTSPVTLEVNPFVDGMSATREVDARAAAGSAVGKPITAKGPEGFNISYEATGPGGFVIDSAGQVRIGDANPGQGVYDVSVTAGFRKPGSPHLDVSASIDVTVTVTSVGPWRQYYKLTASDGADDDWYGSSVTVSRRDVEKTVEGVQVTVTEEVVVAGAPRSNSDAGAIYITIDGNGEVKLTAPTEAANEQYGYSVALQGDTLVVGSNAANGNPGKVYVYSRPADGWTGTLGTPVKLAAGGTNATDSFGKAVAIDGYTIVVGAPTHNIPAAGFPPIPTPLGGIAYVFTKSGDTWGDEPTANLEVEGRSTAAAMGSSVAFIGDTVLGDTVLGDTVLVGAPGEDKVYVFTEPSSGWADATTPAATLTGPEGSYFGASLAVDGSNLVIGAPSEGPGAAYVYSGSGSNWRETDKLTGIGADDGDQFGLSVAISGGYIAVGRANQADNDLEGSVQVFEKAGSRWTPYVLTALDGMANDKFGSSVALAGETLIVGATGVGSMGAAYVFKQIPDVVDSEGNTVQSPGMVDLGRSDQEFSVSSPNGRVTVTIPAGGRPGDYLIGVDDNKGDCLENPRPVAPGQVLRLCGDVNFYDLDGAPAAGAITVDDADHATITINLGFSNTSSFRVFKRNAPGQDWKEVFLCPTPGATGECYNPDPDRSTFIEIGRINSFSQYAVMGPPTVRPPSAPGNLAAKEGNRAWP